MVMYMKYMLALIVAFFPFLHETRYEVQLHSCDQNQIMVEYEDSVISVSLFNIMLSEEGQKQVCPILEKAKIIEMEIDQSSSIEENMEVYLFTDGKLIQKTLLESGAATIAIKNPEYHYAKEMQEASFSKETSASVKKRQDRPNHTRGNFILIMTSGVWFSILILFLYKKFH